MVHLRLRMEKLILSILLIGASLAGSAQELPDDLYGSAARAWMKSNFYDGEHSALTYSNARKKMFGYIANEDDMIECIYSGLKQAHAEGLEISFPEPFNTEHVVPQSLFNSNEPMRSDIHILQPAFQDWNSLRSNYQFRELVDNQVDKWIYLDNSMTSTPSSNIDFYSEYVPFGWEPRESKKGDVARSIMYFFTMYPSYDITSVIDTAQLCDWHEADEVDALELQRNELTEVYQGNLNPYIYRPHWANQAWGCASTVPPNMAPVAVDDQLSVEIGMEATADVLDNDNDTDGSLDPSSVTVISGPIYGETTVQPDGSIQYQADTTHLGNDTFTYVICDNGDPVICDTADVVVSIGELTGVFLSSTKSLHVFPNPTNGIIHFELNEASFGMATIVDLTGKEVHVELVDNGMNELKVNLPNGSYVLVIRDENHQLLGSAQFQVTRK